MKVPSGNHAKCLPGQEGVRGSYATAEEAWRRRCTTRGGVPCRPVPSSRRRVYGPGSAARRIRQGGGRAYAAWCCGAFVVMKVEVVVKEEGSDWRLKG